MKIRIIANHPNDPKASSIEKYIGKTFDADQIRGTKNISVCFDTDMGTMTVYPDEFEIIDTVQELDEFIKRHNHFSIINLEIKEFILANRVALLEILR